MSEKWGEFFNRLKINTENNTLSWKETGDEDTFIAQLGKYTILFALVPPDFFIKIYDDKAKLIDQFTDNNLKNYQEMSDLMQNIRRRNSGADRILEELIQTLSDLDEIPF